MKVIRIREVVGTSSQSSDHAVSQAVAQARAADPDVRGAEVIWTALHGPNLDRWRARVRIASVFDSSTDLGSTST
jgi:flavin-binding protein dodecin